MSQQLHNFFTEVLKMPHYANDHAGSGVKENSHEDQLANLLVKCGFTKIDLMSGVKTFAKGKRKGQSVAAKLFPFLGRKSLKQAIESKFTQDRIADLVHGMPNGSFIMQPGGSQSPPDFLLRDFSGKCVLIEAKSSERTVFPMWNDNFPKQDLIYIFSCGVYNETTIWKGSDFTPPIVELALIEADAILKDAENRVKELMNKVSHINTRGLTLGIREQYSQKGGARYYDCFQHSDRQRCEQNVLNFALNA